MTQTRKKKEINVHTGSIKCCLSEVGVGVLSEEVARNVGVGDEASALMARRLDGVCLFFACIGP